MALTFRQLAGYIDSRLETKRVVNGKRDHVWATKFRIGVATADGRLVSTTCVAAFAAALCSVLYVYDEAGQRLIGFRGPVWLYTPGAWKLELSGGGTVISAGKAMIRLDATGRVTVVCHHEPVLATNVPHIAVAGKTRLQADACTFVEAYMDANVTAVNCKQVHALMTSNVLTESCTVVMAYDEAMLNAFHARLVVAQHQTWVTAVGCNRILQFDQAKVYMS